MPHARPHRSIRLADYASARLDHEAQARAIWRGHGIRGAVPPCAPAAAAVSRLRDVARPGADRCVPPDSCSASSSSCDAWRAPRRAALRNGDPPAAARVVAAIGAWKCCCPSTRRSSRENAGAEQGDRAGTAEIATLERKLESNGFLEKAPADVVAKEQGAAGRTAGGFGDEFGAPGFLIKEARVRAGHSTFLRTRTAFRGFSHPEARFLSALSRGRGQPPFARRGRRCRRSFRAGRIRRGDSRCVHQRFHA